MSAEPAASAPAEVPVGEGEFDYIIVGSGAGGAPLAARLAEAGCRVLVIEAGSNGAAQPAQTPEREVSEVPALHAVSSENPDLSWQFFVKHYTDYPGEQDPKWNDPDVGKDPNRTGIFYPRAAALGGCTIHNAMITIAGPDADWDDLADVVDDDSWRSEVMRSYFQKLERNEYLSPPAKAPTSGWARGWDNLRWIFDGWFFIREPDYTGGRHGYNGWLSTSVADISLGIHDWQLVGMLKGAIKQAKASGIETFRAFVDHFLHGKTLESLDPNHVWRQANHPEGLVQIPLAINKHPFVPAKGSAERERKPGHRSSPRERLLEAQAEHPDKLTIWTDCFVTKVILSEGDAPEARGVEYFRKKHIYGAHPAGVQATAPDESEKRTVMAKREVILCGGAFNTPQLLMLSGIGGAEQLKKHGIPCRSDLPGVGRNLHDRYEVTVISEMEKDFELLEGVTFNLPKSGGPPDPALKRWREDGTGLYSSNGAVLGIFKRSREDLAQPDLFIFGLPLAFRGYRIGYSDSPAHNLFTWAILKAHTQNRDGTVELRSANPLETPEINFHYFHETSWKDHSQGDPNEDPDLLALVEGVKFVNGIAKHAAPVVKRRVNPSEQDVPEINDQSDEQIKDWVRREAWGHHACGSCRMGPKNDPSAVLDSRFRVRGVGKLRVVDASIFPKIPGYFIVTNIYIASEKAADVILEDARGGADSEVYPKQLREEELAAINARRPQAGLPKVNDAEEWKKVTGLAISGGGVRSATFHLGILQAMARARILRRVDFMSTVSGGGYVGSFLGRFFDRLRHDPLFSGGRVSAQLAPDRVERELIAPDSREIDWLRKYGNFLAPGGAGDARANFAIYLRNILTVHFVIGALMLAVFGFANVFRYKLFDPASAALSFGIGMSGASVLPLGHLLERSLGVFWSPWFILFELLLLFLALPRIVGYWIASQDEHERYHWPALAVVFVMMGALFYLGVRDGVMWQPLILALSLASSFIPVEFAWQRGRRREAAVGAGSAESQRLRTRLYLTDDLTLALTVTAGALGFALIDAAGHGLQQWVVAHNENYSRAFTAYGAAIMALVPLARMAAGLFTGSKKPGPPSTISRLFKAQVIAGLLAVTLAAAPLILYSFASHAAYQGGSAFAAGLGASLLGLVITVLLANARALPFVNRSSLEATYASRIARTYLGASNPLRHHPAGANVKEGMPNDDVGCIRDYQPHAAGGPVHLINVTINQTVDFSSQHGNRDRKGENMAVSSLGANIGKRWHCLWADHPQIKTPPAQKRAAQDAACSQCAIEPVGVLPGASHPLIDENGHAAQSVEMLPLRHWIGISGAAIGPGRGQGTQLGTSLLFGLTNVRTGYWWDSGVYDSLRGGFPALNTFRRVLYLLPRVFLTQSLLLFEWIARYAGPWERFWYLSDGGFFENLAAYELIRRRVPRIIVGDGGEDPNFEFEDLADLTRKVRIDFHARIEPLGPVDFEAMNVPETVRKHLGALDELKPALNASGGVAGPSRKHAALFKVVYEDRPCGYNSVLLYIKASMTGDEAPDVRNYKTLHPEFPHESTSDQFFNEAQWESYRKLGEEVGASVFTPVEGGNSPANCDPQWFWNMNLPR